ncbi:hypothetical protein [Microseira wollei]|uniref:Uncharacterized protein n=1 Tax=Microseira wollei NIES-4236 TaxID=2530354 RepID=A0AAV3X756_9CYAN|nr:hypothetical protein [Microseira wollei]GET37146.1 hypothetical protein MiSe_18990 [Microseira wollei NIES-4236]
MQFIKKELDRYERTLLDKQGACNLAEQKQILPPVILVLQKYKLVIIGDREFHSIELA